ncbi:hypothetical protein TSAR_006051 [Trichomalopsis sarcophagae]|uniref:Zinc finger PHD-type domain-containing protein n=1 Tax=Trichomalopsis sarcophagae TaxID=543379 RepID=A0A232F4C4_9HYME|nr:hypothetical protein TSAR_006051 [Trichomalopsis sarcophagae]
MESNRCKICFGETNPFNDPALLCQGECQCKIHIKCLRRGALPSNLIGDVFYDLRCTECSDSNDELLIRQKLSWLTTVILTLYNLREKSNGISRRGYFHWKSDISTFISNNWDYLFHKTVKKKKNWIGTISGTLSHYSGVFFQSGTFELGDQGWWKLIATDPPEVLVEKYYKVLEMKKQQQGKLKAKSVSSSPRSESRISNEDEYSNGAESFKPKETNPPVPAKPTYVEPINHSLPSSEVSDSIPSPCDDFADILDLDIEIPSFEFDFPSFNLAADTIAEELPFQTCNDLPDVFVSDCFQSGTSIAEEPVEDIEVTDTPIVENLQQNSEISKMEYSNEPDEQNENNDNDKTYDLPPPVPSSLVESIHRPWPWDESIKLNPDDVRPLMSEREEEYLLQKIEQYKHLLDRAPPSVQRLYRKLAVRKLKRQYGLPILNIDTFGKDLEFKALLQAKKKGNMVLDRFISEDVSIFFEQRLQGHCDPTSVHSPYTNRLLKPFIRRDTSSKPLWLRVTNELLAKVNKKNPEWTPQTNAPIDYSYIRPQHIPAINSLCSQFFWPGVDCNDRVLAIP